MDNIPAMPIGVTIGMWAAIFVTCLLFGLWIYRAWKGGDSGKQKPDKIMVKDRDDKDFVAVSAEIKEESKRIAEHGEVTEDQLGTGEYKCLCFRKIDNHNVVDFTTIPKPIGEMYNIDPSCPMSGSGYIVKVENGLVVDYDPRSIKYILEESPEYAWFATQWEIVKQVFFVPIKWWQSSSTLFAAAMVAGTFLLGLVALGA